MKTASGIYAQEFRILSSDVDLSRSLRLSTLFTRIQEAAIAHTIELGVPRQKTLDRGLLWVVTQYRARFTRLPQYDEDVRLRSWPGKTMHLFFPRYFRLEDREGNALAEISSLWSLMEASSRRIVFPEEYDITIPEFLMYLSFISSLPSRSCKAVERSGSRFAGITVRCSVSASSEEIISEI